MVSKKKKGFWERTLLIRLFYQIPFMYLTLMLLPEACNLDFCTPALLKGPSLLTFLGLCSFLGFPSHCSSVRAKSF